MTCGARRKVIEPRAPAEQQQRAKLIAGHGIPDENEYRRCGINGCAVPDSLDETEWNADGISQNERHQAVVNRDWKAVLNHVPDGFVVPIRGAKIACENLANPNDIALENGLIESIVSLELLELRSRNGHILPSTG